MKAKNILLTLCSILLLLGAVNSVHAGIVVTITEVNSVVYDQGETAFFTVNVESITTEDETLQLMIPVHENLELNWTFLETDIAAGTTQNFGLEATCNSTVEGNYNFTVIGEAWPANFNYSQATNLGLLETSSYTSYVSLIPETPSLLAISILFTTLLATAVILRRKNGYELHQSAGNARQ